MKKHGKFTAVLIGSLALALSACGGGGGGVGADAIQGKITRSGGSPGGAVVVACNVADDCETGSTAEAGADGSYRIGGLRQGQSYVVLALMDTDGDGQPNLGGVYGGRNPTEVSPPKGGVDITLQAVTPQAQRLEFPAPRFAR